MTNKQRAIRDSVTIAASMLNRKLSPTEKERLIERLENAAKDLRELSDD
jgi:hypothetical protein